MYLHRACPEPYPARFDRARFPEMLRARLEPFGGLIGEIRDAISDDDEIVYGPLHEIKVPPPWNKGRVVICLRRRRARLHTSPNPGSGHGVRRRDRARRRDLRRSDRFLRRSPRSASGAIRA